MVVHDIQIMRAKKTAVGPSTKEGKGLKKSIGRAKGALMKLLDERSMWKMVGTGGSLDAHRMDSDAIKAMLRTGEGPWVSSGAGIELYWGKLAFRCTADLARCTEEVKDLGVQKIRLGRWLVRTSDAVSERLTEVPEASGQHIILCRWYKLIEGLIEEWNALSWGRE